MVAILQLTAVCINMEERVAVFHASIYVNRKIVVNVQSAGFCQRISASKVFLNQYSIYLMETILP